MSVWGDVTFDAGTYQQRSVASAAPSLIPAGVAMASNRLARFGTDRVAVLCGNGQDADGCTHDLGYSRDVATGIITSRLPNEMWLALPGLPVRVEAGAAFSAGATLQSDADGRAVTRTTGVAVLRALDAASAAGDIAWAVFLSGR
ncbi:MAG TPA: hypothetical protein VFW89_04130 [Gemmatimonadaceae bacterium]|nr:hypothetical protein [Gemmatimonadaceae bacterium]